VREKSGNQGDFGALGYLLVRFLGGCSGRGVHRCQQRLRGARKEPLDLAFPRSGIGHTRATIPSQTCKVRESTIGR